MEEQAAASMPMPTVKITTHGRQQIVTSADTASEWEGDEHAQSG